MTLEERYANDFGLLAFYRKKLVEPGWAGELDTVELAYIRTELKKSALLRRKWGFRPSAKRLNEGHIKAVARDGLSAIRKPVSASATKNRIPTK